MRAFKYLAMTALAASAIVLLVFIALWHHFSIKETPTCLVYSIHVSSLNLKALQAEMERHLQQHSLARIEKLGSRGIWSSDETRVESSLNADEASTVFVCSLWERGNDWKTVANDLQQVFIQYSESGSASVQLNPAFYECDPSCFSGTAYPVNFAVFDEKLLARRRGDKSLANPQSPSSHTHLKHK